MTLKNELQELLSKFEVFEREAQALEELPLEVLLPIHNSRRIVGGYLVEGWIASLSNKNEAETGELISAANDWLDNSMQAMAEAVLEVIQNFFVELEGEFGLDVIVVYFTDFPTIQHSLDQAVTRIELPKEEKAEKGVLYLGVNDEKIVRFTNYYEMVYNKVPNFVEERSRREAQRRESEAGKVDNRLGIYLGIGGLIIGLIGIVLAIIFYFVPS